MEVKPIISVVNFIDFTKDVHHAFFEYAIQRAQQADKSIEQYVVEQFGPIPPDVLSIIKPALTTRRFIVARTPNADATLEYIDRHLEDLYAHPVYERNHGLIVLIKSTVITNSSAGAQFGALKKKWLAKNIEITILDPPYWS